MISLKNIKNSLESTYVGEMVVDGYYRIRHFFGCIERFFYWGWVLKDSHDWDYWHLEHIIWLKMERMDKAFKEDEHHIWCEDLDKPLKQLNNSEYAQEYRDYKAFKLAKRLIKRQIDRNTIVYAVGADKKHDKKWGETILNMNSDNSITISRKNVNTDQDKEQERKEWMEVRNLCGKIYERDRKILFTLLEKYGPGWWC